MEASFANSKLKNCGIRSRAKVTQLTQVKQDFQLRFACSCLWMSVLNATMLRLTCVSIGGHGPP